MDFICIALAHAFLGLKYFKFPVSFFKCNTKLEEMKNCSYESLYDVQAQPSNYNIIIFGKCFDVPPNFYIAAISSNKWILLLREIIG